MMEQGLGFNTIRSKKKNPVFRAAQGQAGKVLLNVDIEGGSMELSWSRACAARFFIRIPWTSRLDPRAN